MDGPKKNLMPNTKEYIMENNQPLCMCKDRPASECPGEWEQGCDLGANEKYVAVARSGPSLDKLIERFKGWNAPEVSGYVKPEKKKDT